MNIQILTDFFMWCTILNMSLLMLSFLVLVFAGDFAYKLHGRWFPMPRGTFNVVLYSLLGMYKILIFIFNLIPWLALEIAG